MEALDRADVVARTSLGFDVVVLGGGTAGCLLAARLSEDPSRSVCLVEAGPDYGAHVDGRWPEDMLDARILPTSHGWGFEDPNASRARIMGGCSSHNACFVVWGHPRDYEAWSEPTGGAWSFENLEPHLRRAERALRTRTHSEEELGPWDRGLIHGAMELGYPPLAHLNDLEQPEGVAPYPVNAVGPMRWNTAFAYLDEARGRKNLEIMDRTLVDRLLLPNGRAGGVRLLRDGDDVELSAGIVILAAGAYGSPAILLRSGVGPEGELRALGIPVALPRPGVGRRLMDHCGSWLELAPADRLRSETAAHANIDGVWQSASVLKARSGVEDQGYWDLQIYPWTDLVPGGRGTPEFRFYLTVKIQNVRSEGSVQLMSSDPAALPVVDHGFLSDDGDVARLLEGMKLGRRITATDAMRGLVTEEVDPGPAVSADVDLATFARVHLAGHFHPVGTCRMGPADDPMAVTDSRAKVHGIDNLYVVDASIFPDLPRANTSLTVVAVADRIAGHLSRGE